MRLQLFFDSIAFLNRLMCTSTDLRPVLDPFFHTEEIISSLEKTCSGLLMSNSRILYSVGDRLSSLSQQ